MKKGIFIVFFLLVSAFAFADDFSEIQNIKFNTNKETVITLMVDKGYTVSFPESNMVSFSKINETYLNCRVKEYIFTFSATNNTLRSYAIILQKSRTIYKDAPSYIKTKYNVEIDDFMISNPTVQAFKFSFPDNSCVILIDTFLTDYIIKFYSYDVWLD